MLLIDTHIAPVQGKGLGLFAKSFIASGTTYWIRNESFDRLFVGEVLDRLPHNVVSYIQRHGFQEVTGNWYLCGDNARFTNHSLNPNFINQYDTAGVVDYCYTNRDIAEGEEIVCNYFDTCQTCANGLTLDEVLG